LAWTRYGDLASIIERCQPIPFGPSPCWNFSIAALLAAGEKSRWPLLKSRSLQSAPSYARVGFLGVVDLAGFVNGIMHDLAVDVGVGYLCSVRRRWRLLARPKLGRLHGLDNRRGPFLIVGWLGHLRAFCHHEVSSPALLRFLPFGAPVLSSLVCPCLIFSASRFFALSFGAPFGFDSFLEVINSLHERTVNPSLQPTVPHASL